MKSRTSPNRDKWRAAVNLIFRRLNAAWHRFISSRRRTYLGGGALLIVSAIGFSAWSMTRDDYSEEKPVIVNESLTPNYLITIRSDSNKPAPKPSPEPESKPNLPFMFGVGTELNDAINHRITRETPIKLLTSWYNGPNDMGFMNDWRNTIIPEAYASGYALHLIIYSNDTEQNLDTPYGGACGRPYPLSKQFLSDMRQLAQIFRGDKLYVSMFTEFQTYPCNDNNWVGSENYYRALKDQYLTAMGIFHKQAQGSQVSLSWGGWQTNWDDVGNGGGRSLFKYFADVMNASDFQSFQAMSTTGNLDIITEMTKALSPYSGDVMLAHYKPDNGSQSTFDADMRNIFTTANIYSLKQHGLFAFSFMDTVNMNSSETAYQTVKKVIQNYSD